MHRTPIPLHLTLSIARNAPSCSPPRHVRTRFASLTIYTCVISAWLRVQTLPYSLSALSKLTKYEDHVSSASFGSLFHLLSFEAASKGWLARIYHYHYYTVDILSTANPTKDGTAKGRRWIHRLFRPFKGLSGVDPTVPVKPADTPDSAVSCSCVTENPIPSSPKLPPH